MTALAGVVIADFGRVLATPYATMLLGDLGADVIKVERPGSGDDTRAWGPPYAHGRATYNLAVNRNKRSVGLDLTEPEGLRRARELARRADVVVENFRTGTMARYGLGYEQVRQANPGVIYCSVTGFGPGDGAAMPGYDLLVQAVGGLMSITGAPDGQPLKAGVALVDVLAGLHAAVGILAALRHREATGEGQLVEVNLLTSLLSSMVNQSAAHTLTGAVPRRLGNRHPSIAPYEVFQAADRPIVIAVGNDRQFAALCAALDLPDDPRFRTNELRVAHVDELGAAITSGLGRQPASFWVARLTALGVPCGPVNDIGEAFALAEGLGLRPTVDLDGPPGPMRLTANPISLSATPPRYRRQPPDLGEHTAEVTHWLDAAPTGEDRP
ncbi:CoA transferase [Luedemannella flava]|uniref:CoA transferase n=1 Tax=Luedemannella flava TaxID=349316 RepID=A0ABP4YEX1_9ACTN